VSIQTAIIDILSDQLGIEKDKIKLNSKISDDLGADSLDTVEVVHVLEEKFNMNIPNEEIAKIKTVQDVINYVSSKK